MTPPPGSMRTGRARRRCSPPSRARFAVTFLSRYPESGRAGQIGGSRAPMTSVGLVMWDRSASSVGVERGGGGGDRVKGGLGVDRQAGQRRSDRLRSGVVGSGLGSQVCVAGQVVEGRLVGAGRCPQRGWPRRAGVGEFGQSGIPGGGRGGSATNLLTVYRLSVRHGLVTPGRRRRAARSTSAGRE